MRTKWRMVVCFSMFAVELISLWCLNYVPPATGSSTVDVTKHLTVSLVTKLICINLYFTIKYADV